MIATPTDSLLEHAPCGFVSFGDDGRMLRVNATLCELLGHAPGSLEGGHVDLLLPPAGRLFYQAHLFPFLKLHGRIDEFYLTLATQAGEQLPVLLNAVRHERDRAVQNHCVVVPVRQRRRFEDELLQAKKAAEAAAETEARLRRDLERVDAALRSKRDELLRVNATLEQRVRERTREVRELASQLTLAEAKERARLAQVLHDDLQQQLYAVLFTLRELRRRLGEEAAETALLDETAALVDEAIATSRATTADLSSPVLRGEGLEEALRWLGSHLRRRHGLEVEVDARTEITVPTEGVRVLLFTLVRELLFNVVKHAGVDVAAVTLDEDAHALTITVSDRGRGFDLALLDHAPTGTGFGLPGVRKRLELLGGRFEAYSQPGEGTRIIVSLPVSALGLG